MRPIKGHETHGFTLIELLVALAISLLVMGAIFLTFKSQQDSYVIQDQVTRMQQNLRGAMYMMTRDIQMAGYYTNFDTGLRTCDWDDLDSDNDTTTNTEQGRALIFAVDNTSVSGIKSGTDEIVIVKAVHERDLATGSLTDEGTLVAGESASGNTITLNDLDLDGDGDPDLNATGKRFGVLVKNDLSRADFFEVQSLSGSTLTTRQALAENYTAGDLIFRADVIIYRVTDNATRPALVRKNLGRNSGYVTVAENIDNLQIQYRLKDGTWVNDPAGSQAQVRAVRVAILARTARLNRGYTDPNTYALGNVNYTPADGYRRRVLFSEIKTRNIGL